VLSEQPAAGAAGTANPGGPEAAATGAAVTAVADDIVVAGADGVAVVTTDRA
jgi:hypothetical protein